MKLNNRFCGMVKARFIYLLLSFYSNWKQSEYKEMDRSPLDSIAPV